MEGGNVPVYLEDRDLVRRLLDGQQAAFDQFFNDNFARLHRFALVRLCNDPEAAKDVAQVTLTRALHKLHTYRAESALFTWLCAICRNEASEWLRQHGRYRDHIVLIEDHPEVRAAVDSLRIPEDQTPDRELQRVENLRLIQVALDRMPPRSGDVLEWKYVEGHSLKEIGARLDIGHEAAQALLARARRAFGVVWSSLACGVDDPVGGLAQE
jgi:RNA polymerase sigma-70 factor (ECF subfamily)